MALVPRVLFLKKRQHAYWGQPPGASISSGLGNSIAFLVDMLLAMGIAASAVELVDNNGIDAAVTAFQPTHAIVEALWVVPTKFDVLKKLHPRVQWFVRIHSNLPFLASESIAVAWLGGYLQRSIGVICNAQQAVIDLQAMAVDMGAPEALVSYGPNYYPYPAAPQRKFPGPLTPGQMSIGCYGATRPLKNQLTQAVAAITAANAAGATLRFHINAGRVEGGAASVANLQALFAGSAPRGGHKLVTDPWLDHEAFLALLATMDVVTQVSLTETFNIVAADSVYVGIPTVVSPEVGWLGSYAQADPNDTRAIAKAILSAYGAGTPRLAQQAADLRAASMNAEAVWAQMLGVGS